MAPSSHQPVAGWTPITLENRRRNTISKLENFQNCQKKGKGENFQKNSRQIFHNRGTRATPIPKEGRLSL